MPRIYWPTNTPPIQQPQANPLDQAIDVLMNVQKANEDRQQRGMERQLYGLKMQEAERANRFGEMTMQEKELGLKDLMTDREARNWADQRVQEQVKAGIPYQTAMSQILPDVMAKSPRVGKSLLAETEKNLEMAAKKRDFLTAAQLHNILHPEDLLDKDQATARYGERERFNVSKGQRVMESVGGAKPVVLAEGDTSPSNALELFLQTNPKGTFADYVAQSERGANARAASQDARARAQENLMSRAEQARQAEAFRFEIQNLAKEKRDLVDQLDPVKFMGTEGEAAMIRGQIRELDRQIGFLSGKYREMAGIPEAPPVAGSERLNKWKSSAGTGVTAPAAAPQVGGAPVPPPAAQGPVLPMQNPSGFINLNPNVAPAISSGAPIVDLQALLEMQRRLQQPLVSDPNAVDVQPAQPYPGTSTAPLYQWRP